MVMQLVAMSDTLITIDVIPADDPAWVAHARAVLEAAPPDGDAHAAVLEALRGTDYPEAGVSRSWARATMHPARVAWTAWRDADHQPADRTASSLFASPTPRGGRVSGR